MFLKILFGGIGILFLIKTYLVHSIKKCKNNVSLIGKTVLVTGANTGIGYYSALEFAKRGARVILACRDKVKAEAARTEIIRQTQNDNVVIKLVDLSSLQSVSHFANEILTHEQTLDILVNNAGAGGLKDKQTEDGLQVLMQINYFGPVMLTILLLDILKNSPKSRIINVSSLMAKEGKIDTKKISRYSGRYGTYSNSKICNILFTIKLANKLKETSVSVFSLHPGVVNTDIFRRITGWRKNIFNFVAKHYFKTPEEGAQTIVYTATEPDIEKYSGRHFEECQVVPNYPAANNPNLVDDVWTETLQLLKIEDLEQE